MKRKIMQLQTILNNLTSQEIDSLKIMNDDVTLYSGSVIYYMLKEYSSRFMICENSDEFLYKWSSFKGYKLPDFLKAYTAAYSNYNPLENYSKHESGVEVINDGGTTRTHTPDAEHNTKTTATSYDYTVENIQDSTNKPTTEHYVSTFDGVEKLESKNISQGKTTTNNRTNNDTEQTTTDDLKYTDTETHTTISTTWDGTTYTADKVKGYKNDISGLNNKTNQELIKDSIELSKYSIISSFIYEFISKYTYYAAGGDCYVM